MHLLVLRGSILSCIRRFFLFTFVSRTIITITARFLKLTSTLKTSFRMQWLQVRWFDFMVTSVSRSLSFAQHETQSQFRFIDRFSGSKSHHFENRSKKIRDLVSEGKQNISNNYTARENHGRTRYFPKGIDTWVIHV